MRDPLAARGRTSPGQTAVVGAEDGETTTYAGLDDAVDVLAGRLAAAGIGPGDHLGTLVETSGPTVRLIHAALRIGARLVPLNVRLADPELERQAAVADLDALVADPEHAGAAAAAFDGPVELLDGLRDREPASFEAARRSVEDPVVMLFTSGTTGDPKAVPLTAGNLLAGAVASAFRLGVLPGDRWLLCLPVYHMGGLAPVVRSALYGTALVVHGEFDAASVARATRERGATGISLVPTMLRRILEADETLADALRVVLLGGAPAPPDLVAECEERGVPVHPTYGMTETASQIATATPAEAVEHEGTVGFPLLGTEVSVVADGEPCPPGEPGEIIVSGPTVTPGYYGDPGTTERAFGDRGFRTGDVGYRDAEGRLWVLNRREDRIVTGGENVHPGEVAEVLRSHPGVGDAVVVGLEDEEWGERVAALVAAEDRDLDPADVRDHCRGRLAGFKQPRTIRVVESLPRTASGTVDRAAARERLRGGNV